MDAEPLRMHTERFSMCTEPASGFAPKINYIDSLGVTYGYRSLEELQAENPTHIVHDVEGLIKILSAGSRKTAWRFKPYEACLLS